MRGIIWVVIAIEQIPPNPPFVKRGEALSHIYTMDTLSHVPVLNQSLAWLMSKLMHVTSSLCDALSAWLDMMTVYSIQTFQWVYSRTREILLDYVLHAIHAIDVLLHEMMHTIITASLETKQSLIKLLHILQKQLQLLSHKSARITRELWRKFDETSQLCMWLLVRIN
jgi:hypothetical protein